MGNVLQKDQIASLSPAELARMVLQNSGDYAFIISDLSGTIVAWNPAAENVLGWTADEAVGQNTSIYFTAADREKDQPVAEMRIAAERSVAVDERWHIRRDGTLFWASGQMTALRDHGVLIGYSKILRDRTRERQTEERLRIAQQAGGIGSFELFPESGKIVPSEQFCRLWGVPVRNEFDVADFLALIHPADRQNVVTGNRKLPENALDYTEYRIVRPDTGESRWMARRGELVGDEATGIRRYIGVSYDITHRKRTEQDLRFLAQASAELAGLVDQQSTLDKLAYLAVPSFADWCAVDVLDPDGVLKRVAVAHVDANKVLLAHEFHRRFPPDPNQPRGAWNVLRTGQAEMVGEITNQMLERLVQDPERRAAMRELGFKSYIGVPLSTRGKTFGVVTFISAESARLYNADDLALAEDLARRAAVAIENADLYRGVQEADRGKDIFLATLAHELRNPLAAIMNGLSLMQLAAEDKNKVEQSTHLMQRQAKQLARLVDDLMDISRITTGKIELQKERADLGSILRSAIESSRPYIEAQNHELSVNLPGEPLELFADPVRLAQVFSNLLSNAAKYTNRGGRIEVIVECAPSELIVQVKDNGIGIPSDMLKNVFKMFAQVSHPLERNEGGLGIGLSLVDGLVRMHGGTVEASSEGLGQGSAFVVRLPRDTEETVPAAVEGSYRSESDGKKSAARRILVVDDNVDAATMLAEALRMLGNEVAAVHDGLAAVTAASEAKPDIVLLDIGLPGIDGYEVARRIRVQEKDRHVVLIALTGWGQEKDKQRAADAGFDEHWVKPVSLEQLRGILARD